LTSLSTSPVFDSNFNFPSFASFFGVLLLLLLGALPCLLTLLVIVAYYTVLDCTWRLGE
jgi:hypothetical protein